MTFGAVFAPVTLVSLIAVLAPAQRAIRVHPMIALRTESRRTGLARETGDLPGGSVVDPDDHPGACMTSILSDLTPTVALRTD